MTTTVQSATNTGPRIVPIRSGARYSRAASQDNSRYRIWGKDLTPKIEVGCGFDVADGSPSHPRRVQSRNGFQPGGKERAQR